MEKTFLTWLEDENNQAKTHLGLNQMNRLKTKEETVKILGEVEQAQEVQEQSTLPESERVVRAQRNLVAEHSGRLVEEYIPQGRPWKEGQSYSSRVGGIKVGV